jgi:hypothetical protein
VEDSKKAIILPPASENKQTAIPPRGIVPSGENDIIMRVRAEELAAQIPFNVQGTSPPVISWTNFGFGFCSMTWKCSTACTDLSDLQFLNHTTWKRRKTKRQFSHANDIVCVTPATQIHVPGSVISANKTSFSHNHRFPSSRGA